MEFLKSVLFDRSFPTREQELNESVNFNRPIAFRIELEGLTGDELSQLRSTTMFERCFVLAMKETMGYVHEMYDNNEHLNETGVVIEETGIIIIRPQQPGAFINRFYNNVMHLSSCISSVFTRALQSVATPFELIIRNSVIVTQIMYINTTNSDYDAEDYVTYVYNQHWDPQQDETMPNIYFIKPTSNASNDDRGDGENGENDNHGDDHGDDHGDNDGDDHGDNDGVEEGEIEEPYTVRDGVYTDWLEMINAACIERRHTGETDEDNDGDYIPSSDSNDK